MTGDRRSRQHGRGEILADGLVHGLAIAAALAGGSFVLARAIGEASGHITVLCIYMLSLLAMLGFSMAYNLAPDSPAKRLLRRFDHSAIYVLIAATYTPLIVQLHEAWLTLALALIVWLGAGAGVAVKLFGRGRHSGVTVAAYLALGWVGVFAVYFFWQALPGVTLALIAIGGVLYSLGVPFYLWERLKYQRAIWHGFVAGAAACHFAGIAWLYL